MKPSKTTPSTTITTTTPTTRRYLTIPSVTGPSLSVSPSISSLAPSPCSSSLVHPLLLEDLSHSRYASKTSLHNNNSLDNKRRKSFSIDPRGTFNLLWLLNQSLIFVYNAVTIPLRYAFPQVQNQLFYAWIMLDYFTDSLLLLHLSFVAPRVSFMHNGFWVNNRHRLWINYRDNGSFMWDLLSLLPLDLLYFQFGSDQTVLRLPRLLKFVSAKELMLRLDLKSSRPHVLRLLRTLFIMLYLIHLQTCFYYLLSTQIGLGKDSFVYNGQGNAYIRCFYFATRTLTSIGNNRGRRVTTNNIVEMLFMIVSWLSGMFVFAVLIGDVRDNVAKVREQSSRLRRRMDNLIEYLNKNRVNEELRTRVKLWMEYALREEKQGFGVNELELMDKLPIKLRTDLAMRVHFQTVSKVKLFRNCDLGLIKEVVVALRPTLYLPGDYVCRRNELGTQMFIVQSGKLHVLGGIEGSTVLCPLGEGAVFGEIALLGDNKNCNRRTADVMAVGFATLLVLHKRNLDLILNEYPRARELLRERAEKFMRQNERVLRRQRAQKQRESLVSTIIQTNNSNHNENNHEMITKENEDEIKICEEELKEEAAMENCEDNDEECLPFLVSDSDTSSLCSDEFEEECISFVGDAFFT